MNTKDVARDSYHLATRLEECPFNAFWVVLLDDGTEIYQSEDRADLKECSPWMRLKQLCQETGRKILHMAYAFRDGNGTQINCLPNAGGYFFSKRVRTLLTAHPALAGFTDDAIGVGYLRGNMLTVTWLRNDGVREEDNRNITENEPFNLIRS